MASETVLKIFDDLKELHNAKDSDYAGEVPLSNFRRCEQFGIPAWKGCLVRLSDKFSRVVSLVQKDGDHAVNGESLIDTLHDMAVYSIITSVLLGEAQGATRGCVSMDKEGERAAKIENMAYRVSEDVKENARAWNENEMVMKW